MSLISSKYAATLSEHSHRPFALQNGAWIMNQSWCNLLFAHWPVDIEQLRQLVPPQLELDLYEGIAYIGVVPFEMREVSPRYTPSLPWLSYFPELNVRIYVRHKGRQGVFFFSLDAGNPLAVWIARRFYHLPYYNATMLCRHEKSTYHYSSTRKKRNRLSEIDIRASGYEDQNCELDVTYAPAGPVYYSVPGSLEHFLTERYCLFTVYREQVFCGHIHHKAWPLQKAEAEWRHNSMTATLGLKLDGEPLLHYVENIDTVEWPIRKQDFHAI
jgi:uncharacterized protein YqjF (DUF2071 family)